MNAQITKYFKTWSIYAGSENLTNFTQMHPIIDVENPGKCHGFTFSDVRKTRCSGKNSRELAAVALFPDEDGNQ
jgi:hypothetical protein